MRTELVKTSAHAGLDTPIYVQEIWAKTAEELYADVLWSDLSKGGGHNHSSGVAFARKAEINSDGKFIARKRILDSLNTNAWCGNLKILTMPGIRFTFERALLKTRRGLTDIYCVERDPIIYYSSLAYIPSLERGVTQLSPHSLKTKTIKGFYFTTIESFVTDPYCPVFDAAWLDFTGYMTPALLKKIQLFYLSKINWQLTITCLNARYSHATRAEVQRYGSIENWITKTLGGFVCDVFRYTDGKSAMVQITLQKDWLEYVEMA